MFNCVSCSVAFKLYQGRYFYMAGNLKMFDAYTRWKAQGLKRSLNQELADAFGVNRSTIYNWSKKPITIDGVKYSNWEEAYEAETREARKNYEHEINNKIADGYKLLDVIADEVMMKYLLRVKEDDYKPTLDELVKITELVDKRNERIVATSDDNSESNQNVNFSISFRGDTVENP